MRHRQDRVDTESLLVLDAHIATTMEDVGPIVFVRIYVLWGTGLALYGMFMTLFVNSCSR